MSLDYDLRKMVNRDLNFPAETNGDLSGVVQTMIWATIPVGINEITTVNALEFHRRMTMWINQVGPFFNRMTDDGPVPIIPTYNQVMAATGLRTNASPKTRHKFWKDFERAYFG